MNICRRTFLRVSSIAAAVAASNPGRLFANPLDLPIGCQTYPVRTSINSDFSGTMKMIASAGFQTVELCSPVGYPEFKILGSYRPKELRTMFNDFGLRCVSAHFVPQELRDDPSGRIAWAHEFGLTQMVVPSLGIGMPRGVPPTMDDIKRLTDEFNDFASKAHAAKIVAVVHNEGFEVSHIDGEKTYDILLSRLDSALVKFQFQISTIRQGFDPVEYFTRYPGRFISMHLQDWIATGDTPRPKFVPLGMGSVQWPKVFAAARTGGVQNYFVEMDFETMKASVPYLKQLVI